MLATDIDDIGRAAVVEAVGAQRDQLMLAKRGMNLGFVFDEFLAMLGHELRIALAPIRTSADTIGTLTPPDSPISASSSILSRQAGT